jgi:pimeloyl-ACP methyl ester carboxylesterase
MSERGYIHLLFIMSFIITAGLTLISCAPARNDSLTQEELNHFNIISRAGIVATESDYHGYRCFDFTFEGREAKIVRPRQTGAGVPWLWRARFWGHEPQTEIALLERGFHVVFCDVAELFGNDKAIGIWNKFYQMLVDAGFARKSAFIAFSRGGVYAYRWALTYPERVACVYADAPVLDVKSWPGGKGRGHGNPEEWERFKTDFSLMSEAEALNWRGNPLDMTDQIVQTGIPLLHICGDADVTVPLEENTDLFEKKILAAGGSIQVIRKPGVGHHPHSLVDPAPIVEFILRATGQKR